MFPNEQQTELREAALRKRHGLIPKQAPTITDAVNQLISDVTAMYITGDTHLSSCVDVNISEVQGLDFCPLVLLACNPNTSMAYALVEKKLHDTFRPLLKARIDTTKVALIELRTKMLYDNVTCRFIVSLEVIDPSS